MDQEYVSPYGIKSSDVCDIAQLGNTCFDVAIPKQLLEIAATSALALSRVSYNANSEHFGNRGNYLQKHEERIVSQIISDGLLPPLHAGTGSDMLLDDEVLLMGIVSILQLRGVNSRKILSGIHTQLADSRTLGQFASCVFTNKNTCTATECLCRLFDTLIRGKTSRDDGTVGHEIYNLYRGNNVTSDLELLREYLHAKWEKGLLVLGKFATTEDASLAFAIVLPEYILA